LGLPIWKLLGGGFHSKMRAYASSLFGNTPHETGERARRFRDKGFDAVKFGWAPMGESAANDLALVREARSGLGEDGDLLIDAGLAWDSKTAIQRAKAFSEFNIFWLEFIVVKFLDFSVFIFRNFLFFENIIFQKKSIKNLKVKDEAKFHCGSNGSTLSL